MPLEVISFCSYLKTDDYSVWRPQDHNATKFVKALKGEQLNGYAYVPVLGVQCHLSNANLDDSIEWFGHMAAHYMQQNGLEPPFVLVPIPNSSAVSKSPKPRTLKLAKAIAARLGNETKVADCLRWKKAIGSARKGGGTRNARILHENLVLIEELDEELPHIMIDDALSSGGHLQACAAKLQSEGATVTKAFCGGDTVHEPPQDAFAIFRRELDDYEPDE